MRINCNKEEFYIMSINCDSGVCGYCVLSDICDKERRFVDLVDLIDDIDMNNENT